MEGVLRQLLYFTVFVVRACMCIVKVSVTVCVFVGVCSLYVCAFDRLKQLTLPLASSSLPITI